MNSDKKDDNKRPTASSKYFENRDCEYYPCHDIQAPGFNCLFCFCPLYFALCTGKPNYTVINGITFKSCTECEYPHRPENYQTIINCIASMFEDGQHE
jgi:Zn-finger protein